MYIYIYIHICDNYKKETLVCYCQIAPTYDQGSLNNKFKLP